MISNKEILERYPFMCMADWNGNPIRDEDLIAFDEGVPQGWVECFGLLLCEDLDKALTEDQKKRFYFIQAKEKWGRLTMYANFYTDEVQKILGHYAAFSEQVCVHCGRVGVPTTNYGWIYPVCKECWDENQERLERELESWTKIPYEEATHEYSGFDPFYRYRSYKDGEWENHEESIQYIYDRVDEKFKK